MRKYVSYRRVSSRVQGMSGLGLEAQADYINHYSSIDGELVADFVEVYTGTELSGCLELRKAINLCKSNGYTLIIAKTDRFRNVIEALQVYEELNGRLVCCDLPNSDKFTLTIFFSLAEREAELISIRTKAALKAKRKRGELQGGSEGQWGKTKQMNEEEVSIYREEVCLKKARKASAKAVSEKAARNPNNIAFKSFIMNWIEDRGNITASTDWELISDRLNKMQLKTSTGLEFTAKNARSMWHNNKNKFFNNI